MDETHNHLIQKHLVLKRTKHQKLTSSGAPGSLKEISSLSKNDATTSF